MKLIETMCQQARTAARQLSCVTSAEKWAAILALAQGLRDGQADILQANALDMAAGQTKGLSNALLDRLRLDAGRVEAMAAGVEAIANLGDPVNRVLAEWQRPNGLTIQRVSVPIGVIAVIYESRPNVTTDAAALCIQSGNAVILRGGSESAHSNQAIGRVIANALKL